MDRTANVTRPNAALFLADDCATQLADDLLGYAGVCNRLYGESTWFQPFFDSHCRRMLTFAGLLSGSNAAHYGY